MWYLGPVPAVLTAAVGGQRRAAGQRAHTIRLLRPTERQCTRQTAESVTATRWRMKAKSDRRGSDRMHRSVCEK